MLFRSADAVRRFKAVEHRLEPVGTFNGARWYNDSKATNPDSTYKALAAFREPIILIAGGRNKGIDLEPLAQAIARRVTGLVTMGETGDELARRVRDAGLDRVERAADLSDAVRKAAALARFWRPAVRQIRQTSAGASNRPSLRFAPSCARRLGPLKSIAGPAPR